MQEQQQRGVSEATLLAFKRHILQRSAGFASEPMADLFRVNLLGAMLDRYDGLRAQGLSEGASRGRVLYEFDDVAARMREQGFEEDTDEAEISEWPKLTEAEVERFMQERDVYLHRTGMGTALCSACVTPVMLGAALSSSSDGFALLGIVGMFAMIGLGVYAMATAAKPKKQSAIKKGRFALSRRMRERLSQMREDVERRARLRFGKGVALLVACPMPIFIGAALSGDSFALLGVAGMMMMIGLGVYELMLADGEKKTMKQLLDHP